MGRDIADAGRRWVGKTFQWNDWPGIETLIHIAARMSDELISIAEHLEDDEEVDLAYQGKTYRYPKRFFLVHAMEHGTEHRTEVTLALAHVGVATPDLDGWSYAASAGYGQETSTKP
jgi:uncharacterized damage-inducible protein DinB